MRSFIKWLHAHNANLDPKDRCGVWGLDLYSLDTSINAIIKSVDKYYPEDSKVLREYYNCFDRVGDSDPQRYGLMASLLGEGHSCRKDFQDALQEVIRQTESFIGRDCSTHADIHTRDLAFIIEQNARIVVNAEVYYRSMYTDKIIQQTDEEGKQFIPKSSWEIRDSHFFETLENVRQHLQASRGKNGVAVWAHNSHLGDARYVYAGTQREADLGLSKELNIGQLVKELHPLHAIR